jgi:hypothetical protein
MKVTILILLFCGILFGKVYAQNSYSIKGAVTDTSAKVSLVNSDVIVLNAKDSILRAFTRVHADGSFAIDHLHKGNFILLITYPGYADFVERFTLDSVNNTHDFGKLNMILKSKLLADVIIKAKVTPIKIKGDTTEYNAKAYVINPNDKVEDLLKQLPGIQVDKDGKITAQGETVTKVLVDGEEFFGDDPTLVTRNLRADMVDKVQLYDKKSDQAAFTGIDDGKTTKTINIKLKEDKKNGLFGDINANVGTDGYYEGQLQFNRFRDKEKFAIYGTAANDGRTGLDWSQDNNLGISTGDVQFVDGGLMINLSGDNDALDSFSGYYDGKGIPVAESGGVHYDDKWDGDKQSINTNYKIGAIDVTGVTETNTQQTLPTGILSTGGNENFNDYGFRQKLDVTWQIALDTTSNFKISADATDKDFHVNNRYYNVTDSANNLLNVDNRDVINHGTTQIFDVTGLYTKKFKKAGRTLSWSLGESYNDAKTDGFLNSEIHYYNNKGVVDSSQTINQYKTTNTLSSVVNSNITWSEPLIKKLALLLNYGLSVNNSTIDRESFNPSNPGLYNLLDSAYSNDYKFNQFTNQLGAIFNYKNKKAIFNFGTKVSAVDFKQIDLYTGDILRRSFINWAPQATFSYRFSQQGSLRINYYGTTTQPTIDQIQPVLVNTDPLNIFIGNPLLKPSFGNRLYLFYNSYQVLSGNQLFINGNFSNTYNAIVNNTVTSVSGQNTTQYVNLKNQVPFAYTLYTYLGKSVKPFDINVGINFNSSANVSYSYIDNALDKAQSFSYGAELQLSKYVQNKYDFNIQTGPSYTFSTMSLQPSANNNAAGYTAQGSFNLQLPLKFGAGSSVNYTYNAKTQYFSAEYLTKWNAYIYKTFLKDDKMKISLSGNDLLNENTNFSRGLSGNTSTQTYTSGIKRFFMLSLTWNFTKFGTLPPKN